MLFEADAELPRQLMQTPVDLVFNIAEGVAGRNREAAVPALCELMGIPYTGSDAATLSIALDKALSKRVLLQHGILTAEFQVMETGRERLSSKLKFPLIVKPNQEGSSKGVSASASVVDDEEGLRAVVRELIDRYRQPALIEVYIPGREFTVGLLGDRRPRVLPPMEILFKDKSNQRPVYDFQIKQEWEKHVAYQCPAQLSPAELKAIERVCRETFAALDCRDVARVDLRMTPKGDIYVIEVNPLPGLTPGYSDLCLIAHGGRHRVPDADRRDPRRRPQAAAREAARGEDRGARRGQTGGQAATPARPPRNGAPPAAASNGSGANASARRRRQRPTAANARPAVAPGGLPPTPASGMRAAPPRAGLLDRPLPRRRPRTPSPTSRGVRVGHTTLIDGDGPLEVGKGPVRTGVTAIIPNADVFENRVIAGGFVLNGAGEVSGITQVQEWGLLETPILLTNTMAVGKVSDAAVKWMTKKWPEIGGEDDVVIPLVGECDDSWLNDAVGRHVRSEHVYRAIEQATAGTVAEGSVGAGHRAHHLRLQGRHRHQLAPGRRSRGPTTPSASWCSRTSASCARCASTARRSARCWSRSSGRRGASATPARSSRSSPPTRRCCRRSWCASASGRRWASAASGSFAAHGSGEIIVAFSTANRVPRADLQDDRHARASCSTRPAIRSTRRSSSAPRRRSSTRCAWATRCAASRATSRRRCRSTASATSCRRYRQAFQHRRASATIRCASASSSRTSGRSRRPSRGIYLALAAHRRGHDVRFVSVDDLSFLDDNNILAHDDARARRRLRRPGRLRARARLRRGGRRGGHAGQLRRGLPALQPDPRGRGAPGRAAHRLRLAAAAGAARW